MRIWVWKASLGEMYSGGGGGGGGDHIRLVLTKNDSRVSSELVKHASASQRKIGC